MIYSMTGYAALSQELPQGTLNLEIKSVNSRYLDTQFRIVDELRGLEPSLRELIGARLARGKIDCRLGFSAAITAESLSRVNSGLIDQLLSLNQLVQERAPNAAPLSVAEILRWPGVIASEELSKEALKDAVLALLTQALDDLAATRSREGAKLKDILLDRAAQMEGLVARIKPKTATIVANFQEKLRQKIKEAEVGGDDERIRQEIVLFAQKIDVDEELERLTTHLTELKRVLGKGGGVGKRLDFLMQELNREANTLGSKSVDAEMSQASMDMKVLIDQMREQIQNIE
ncbi:MAG: YicC family protein [Burkholderiales bacterium]|nr:YicC family protein [Burkholderiales bacterium]